MMRILSSVAVAALSLMQAAAAQTALPAVCVFTPAPALPDGATATNAQMVSAREALQQWRNSRAAEIAACKAALEQTQAQLNAMQLAHNAAVTDTDAAIDRFAAENAEYTARARPRRGGANRSGQ